MGEQLSAIAKDLHEVAPSAGEPEKLEQWLGALLPRVVFRGGWKSAERRADAEPLVTGRPEPYAESTLRKRAVLLDEQGCTHQVARAVWRQVDQAVKAQGEPVVVYTDLFDQPYYTKKLAHAAPIGRLGNRLLAATYFGLTTVALADGTTLFAHLSWHKPAAPLRDALDDLFEDEQRLEWWHQWVWVHILDRGANGDPVLRELYALEVPYLTIGRKEAELWRFHAAPDRDEAGRALVFRPDARLGGDTEDGPWECFVAAAPKDPESRRGLCFRAGLRFTVTELAGLTTLYKSRWPSMENPIKDLIALGFDRNRTRRLELTTSRGQDGDRMRLEEQRARLLEQVQEVREGAPFSGAAKVLTLASALAHNRERLEELEADQELKNARPEGGAERLGKWLQLLAHNALALALRRSPEARVREMSVALLFDLLLGRPMTACLGARALTLHVNRLPSPDDQHLQEALIAVFNGLNLRCRGKSLELRLYPAGREAK